MNVSIASPNVRVNQTGSPASIFQPSQTTVSQAERKEREEIVPPHSTTGQNTAPPLPSTEEPPNCPICLEPFKTLAILQPCGHTSHFKCIKRWLFTPLLGFDAETATCPLCRKRIRTLIFGCPVYKRDEFITIADFLSRKYCTGQRQRPPPPGGSENNGRTNLNRMTEDSEEPRLCSIRHCSRCQRCRELVRQRRLVHQGFARRDYISDEQWEESQRMVDDAAGWGASRPAGPFRALRSRESGSSDLEDFKNNRN
jgi:hypothetical protein